MYVPAFPEEVVDYDEYALIFIIISILFNV